MKALTRDRYGLPDVLEVREVEQPVPGEGEVLVRVHAASINDWDWGLLQGPTLPFLPSPPKPILGSDVAGRVAALGSGIQRFRAGDEVYGDLSRYGRVGWGGLAEYVCARERDLVTKPARMTFEQAAALPQAGQLAVQALFAHGPLRAGQTILINGAGGGVGTIGVQVAKAHGAEVTGVDSLPKLEMMRAIGFDHVIDYRAEDFTKNGRRYDLIVDTKTVRLIALKQNRDLPYLHECFEAGQLAPVIDGPYALNEGADAFRHFGAANHLGKVIITMGLP